MIWNRKGDHGSSITGKKSKPVVRLEKILKSEYYQANTDGDDNVHGTFLSSSSQVTVMQSRGARRRNYSTYCFKRIKLM